MKKTLITFWITCIVLMALQVNQLQSALTSARGGVFGGGLVAANSPFSSLSYGRVLPFSVTITATPVPRGSGGTTNTVTNQDKVNLVVSPTVVVSDYLVTVTPSEFNRTNPSYTLTSTNTGVIGNPATNGLATFVAAGNSAFQVVSAGYTNNFPVTVTSNASGSLTNLMSYVTNSLSRHIRDRVDSSLVGKSPSTQWDIFSSRNDASTNYVYNSNLWLTNANLSGVAVYNTSSGGPWMAGTLISPDVVLFAAHYQINNGSSVRFVDTNNVVYTRTITNTITAPGYSPTFPDWALGKLSTNITNVPFARILPTNWVVKIPSSIGTPAVGFNQFRQLTVRNLLNIGTNLITGVTNTLSFVAPTETNRAAFYRDAITYDSGSPVFWIINDTPVLLTTWTYGGASSGTFTSEQRAAINAAMTTIGSTNQLTPIDLSGFPSY